MYSKFKALEQVIKASNDCPHYSSAWVRVATLQGGYDVILQCVRCGMLHGNERPHRAGDLNLPWVDDAARVEAKEKIAATKEYRDEAIRKWRRLFDEYRNTVEWKNRVGLVMRRNMDACEACYHPAVTVIHRSYEHVGDEALFELVAVCEECARKYRIEPW